MQTLNIKVIPRASKNEIAETMADGTLKVRVTAPPADGKANEAVITLLAAHFSTKKQNIRIVRGHTGRRKIVEITD